MSDRGSFRGGFSRGGRGGGGDRGGRGGGGRQHRGGGGGGHQQRQQGDQQQSQQQEKPKKENILDLTKYMDKEVNVKFNGGREGVLYDFISFHVCLIHADFLFCSYGCAERLRPAHEPCPG